jgi:hypothetical protein
MTALEGGALGPKVFRYVEISASSAIIDTKFVARRRRPGRTGGVRPAQ